MRESDGRITVTALTRPISVDEWAKAGLMVREALSPDARNASLLNTAANGLHPQWREVTGEGTESPNGPNARPKLPLLLRLTRRGNIVSAAYSADGGRSFRPAAVPVTFVRPLPATIYAGLAITSHDESQISEARFREMKIEPLDRP